MMHPENIKEQTKHLSAEDMIKFLVDYFGEKIALASSFSAEDQILTDMLVKTGSKPCVISLDTGRLPQATYEVMEKTRRKYALDIEIVFPDYTKVEAMVKRYGPNLFFESIENRQLCCRIRKIEPLRRALAPLSAWICGLRQDQSSTRRGIERVQWDEKFGLIKVCPLVQWNTAQIWKYIHHHDVPYNALHDQGYPSIGCEPCTRALSPGEDIRAGRWWWERPEQKECGLHQP